MMRKTAIRRPARPRRAEAGAGAHRGWAMVVLAGLGVGIAGILTWFHLSGTPALCAGAGGCEQVQASRFASVAGAPVALLGLALYLGLLVLGLWRAWGGRATPLTVSLALFGLALAGTLYSAYLTYLELAVIGAVCPWCVASAALVTALWLLAAWDVASLAYAAGEPAGDGARERP